MSAVNPWYETKTDAVPEMEKALCQNRKLSSNTVRR